LLIAFLMGCTVSKSFEEGIPSSRKAGRKILPSGSPSNDEHSTEKHADLSPETQPNSGATTPSLSERGRSRPVTGSVSKDVPVEIFAKERPKGLDMTKVRINRVLYHVFGDIRAPARGVEQQRAKFTITILSPRFDF